MARIPYHKLRNLRSGMTVWRVFGHLNKDNDNIKWLEAEEYHVLGKRVLHHHAGCRKGSGTMRMHWKRYESVQAGRRPSWMYRGRVHFLNDLEGYGCFDSRRSALRFVAEIKAGQHPEITAAMKRHREDMAFLDKMQDDYDDFDDFDDRFDDSGSMQED